MIQPTFLGGGDETMLARLLRLKAAGVINGLKEYTVTGNPVSFEASAAKPLKSMTIPFTAVQAGTGDPSPDNIRPISGFTGIDVARAGVNLWDEQWEVGAIDDNGQNTTSGGNFRSTNYIPVLPGMRFYVYYELPEGAELRSNIRLFYYDQNKTYISNAWTGKSAATVPSNAYYVRFYGDSAFNSQNDNVSFNFPSSDTSYHPYSGESHRIEFPATGKNLLNPHMFDDRPSYYTAESNGTITVKSTDYSPWANIEFTAMKAGTYTISYTADSGEASLRTENNYDEIHHVTPGNPVTFTVMEGEGIKIKVGVGASSYPMTASVQIEAGSSATAFEPFTNTVYGGSLDALTGVLTVTHEKLVFDGSEKWSFTAGTDSNRVIKSVAEYTGQIESYPPLNYMKSASKGAWSGYVSTVGNLVCRIATTIDSAEAWSTYLEENPLEMVVELATPITYQLDPVTIQTLKGDNTIWANTNGDNTIIYLSKKE